MIPMFKSFIPNFKLYNIIMNRNSTDKAFILRLLMLTLVQSGPTEQKNSDAGTKLSLLSFHSFVRTKINQRIFDNRV